MNNATSFKITTKVTQAPAMCGRAGNRTTMFFVNGVHVCTEDIGRELYCQVKNGVPSNLRIQSKRHVQVRWQYDAVRRLLPAGASFDFAIACPDLKWGYTGQGMTRKDLTDRLNMAALAVATV